MFRYLLCLESTLLFYYRAITYRGSRRKNLTQTTNSMSTSSNVQRLVATNSAELQTRGLKLNIATAAEARGGKKDELMTTSQLFSNHKNPIAVWSLSYVVLVSIITSTPICSLSVCIICSFWSTTTAVLELPNCLCMSENKQETATRLFTPEDTLFADQSLTKHSTS